MKSIARFSWFVGLLLVADLGPAAPALANDQIPWVADFRIACGMAADQRRLVLLHFYNDNCEPCVRLEQNVFNQPEVAAAVSQNYLPVKVHAGKNPQLASRYNVNRWPTDVIVTPSGLEVYRTVSPQIPTDYIALLNKVAQQSGASAGRQWNSPLGPAVKPAAAEAADATHAAAADTQAAANEAAASAQGAMTGAYKRWGDSIEQFKGASDNARATMQQTGQQAGDTAQQAQQQAAGTARQWSQPATDATQRYEQQAGDSYRQFRDQANQTGQQWRDISTPCRAEMLQQQAETAKQEWRAAAQQTTEQAGNAARDFRSQWQPAAGESPFNRRSAFMSQEQSPATQAPAAVGSAASTNTAIPPQATAAAPAAPTTPVLTTQPPLPTANPWFAAAPPQQPRQPERSAPIESPPASSPAGSYAPPVAAPSQPAAQSPNVVAAGNQPMVPASQAPPIALDGFCPVTLLETVARDPNDRGAWKKGDKRFGAIHRGRTYLFTSPENQQKFLANPDAFSPVLAGCDPVRYAERGEVVDGKRAYGIVTADRRIFLFADEASRNRFEQSPASYSAVIHQAMLRSEAGAKYR